MYRSKKLLKSVREFDCQSCGRRGPSIPAHANWHEYGKGTGLKAHDCYVAALCQCCHDWVDGRVGKFTNEEKKELWQRAWIRTVLLWFEQGVVK